jgi:hypothetical protein
VGISPEFFLKDDYTSIETILEIRKETRSAFGSPLEDKTPTKLDLP